MCQMTAQHDLEINFETCKGMIERAGNRNCKVCFFSCCHKLFFEKVITFLDDIFSRMLRLRR